MESLQSTCKAWNIGSHTFIMGALTSSSIFSSCGTCPNSGRMLAAAVDPVKSRGGLSVRDLQGISQRENVQLKLRMYTSSTAQGGGGSFKNRKPIGEVGCCESGMAKRIHWWTERRLRSPLCLSLFLWLSTYLSIFYVSIYLSSYLSLSFSLSSNYLSTYLPIYLSTSLPIYLSTYLPIYLSTYLPIYLSISLSLFHLSICLAVYLSIYLSICLSVCLPVYLSCSVIQCIVV